MSPNTCKPCLQSLQRARGRNRVSAPAASSLSTARVLVLTDNNLLLSMLCLPVRRRAVHGAPDKITAVREETTRERQSQEGSPGFGRGLGAGVVRLFHLRHRGCIGVRRSV